MLGMAADVGKSRAHKKNQMALSNHLNNRQSREGEVGRDCSVFVIVFELVLQK